MLSDVLETDVNWPGRSRYDVERTGPSADSGLMHGREAKAVSTICPSLLQLLTILLAGCQRYRARWLRCPLARWHCAAKAESSSCPNGESRHLILMSAINAWTLDCYWWHYRNRSLRWIRRCPQRWWSCRSASWLYCNGHCDIFYGSGPWRNDNAFPCLWFICMFLFGYIKIPSLKSDCRRIMLLDGLTRLSVLPWVTITGTRMLSLYPQKLRRQRLSFHTGTLKLIREHGSRSSLLSLLLSICMRNFIPATCLLLTFINHSISLAVQYNTMARLNSGSPVLK